MTCAPPIIQGGRGQRNVMVQKPGKSEIDRAAETFIGLPAAELSSLGGARGAILGVPGCTPYGSVGAYCADAPAAIRAALTGYAASSGHVDFDASPPAIFNEPDIAASIVDCGDLPFDTGNFAANRTRLRDAVTRILDEGAVPILLGGDDSIQTPVFEAPAGRGRFTNLQIDTHIDRRAEPPS